MCVLCVLWGDGRPVTNTCADAFSGVLPECSDTAITYPVMGNMANSGSRCTAAVVSA